MESEKTYEPQKYEGPIYKKWEEAEAFKPVDRGAHARYSIIMPPPNANGALHAGHAVGYTLTDIITRFKRMQGFETLWLPGTDHAGIETQFVYERDVLAKAGKSRFDLGPAKYYEEVMAFTKNSEQTILNQMRSMGFSADWRLKKFTLDSDIVAIVYDTFRKLYEAGLVYRGNRIVNWCPTCQSAFADIEIAHREQEDIMYTLDYGPIKIATVRPETIFADVAVAVNPKDKRYVDLVGKQAIIPLVERAIPIIADDYVEPESGTGALKVTPGHDPNDYEIGQRHNLTEISVIDLEGKLINVPQSLAGLTVPDGRKAVVEALKKAGKITAETAVKHAVGFHERCGTIIEPLISEQWFLRVKDLNQPVIKALENEDVKLFPARFKKIALNWLAGEHDWNISRQNWYGIRIPIYYKTSNDPKKQLHIFALTEAEADTYYGVGNYRAETDTFDTWFSSGQWPFATLTTTGLFKQFYPTDLMGTAREILHKWVTRMIMFGIYQTGKVPFKNVYLWGLITDEKGQKMSKSKGNVIDPLVTSAKYGTDALRLAGAISNTPGTDSPLSESRVMAMRNFVNKLWNVSRFVLDHLDQSVEPATKPASLADQWMLTRLSYGVRDISNLIETYHLNEAANRLYHLVWDDFADWYVETTKLAENKAVLAYGLETILKLAHPFIPFVSEAIWEKLPNRKDMLIISPWPKPGETYEAETRQFAQIQALITEIRTLSAELELKKVGLYHQNSKLISANADLIKKLTHLSEIQVVTTGSGLPLLSTSDSAWLGVEHETVRSYKKRLEQKLIETKNYLEGLDKQLANRRFSDTAAKDVVEATKARQTAAAGRLHQIQLQLEQLADI